MPTYSELLKDPRWQKVRLKRLESAEWMCQSCYSSEDMLSVHHKRYVKGRKPWEYMDHELVVLCQPCHEDEHESKRLHSDLVSVMDVDGPGCESDSFAMMAGYLSEMRPHAYAQPTYAQFCVRNPYSFELGRLMAGMSVRVPTKHVFGEMLGQLGQEGSDMDVIVERMLSKTREES